jgi:hypothetical protein
MKLGLARVWVVSLAAAVLLGAGLTVFIILAGGAQVTENVQTISEQGTDSKLSKAQQQFRKQWQKGCEGTGPITLTHLPMRPEDFSNFIPYGLLAGAHVTPIDHVYFAPKDYRSPRDAYPVYMMADGYLIDIGRRRQSTDTGEKKAEEFRLTFQHTCTFYTYFDLVTSLSDEVYAAFPKIKTNDYATGHMKIKGGQQIGKIGGQTLDTAVYNLESVLTGFIHPELYDGEGWKIHTDDFIKYFSQSHQELINSRNPRVAEPLSGKIDYDVDGKLIGNWFQEGTNGYVDNSQPGGGDYWSGHLAVVPDLYDPTAFWISIGNWQGQAEQFRAKGNAPDPATVGVESGAITYELTSNTYLQANGQPWDNMSLTGTVTARAGTFVAGVALFQLVEPRKLKAEYFPGQTASQVSGFTDRAEFYYR